jgi:hypothetical protein
MQTELKTRLKAYLAVSDDDKPGSVRQREGRGGTETHQFFRFSSAITHSRLKCPPSFTQASVPAGILSATATAHLDRDSRITKKTAYKPCASGGSGVQESDRQASTASA